MLIFETNGLKAPCFQGVEIKRFQHSLQADVNLHTANDLGPGEGAAVVNKTAPAVQMVGLCNRL